MKIIVTYQQAVIIKNALAFSGWKIPNKPELNYLSDAFQLALDTYAQEHPANVHDNSIEIDLTDSLEERY